MNFLYNASRVASLIYFIDKPLLDKISNSVMAITTSNNKYSMRSKCNLLGTGNEYLFWYQVLS